jgi:hypothetical protein
MMQLLRTRGKRLLRALVLLSGFLIALGGVNRGQDLQDARGSDNSLARIRSGLNSRLSNGGWKYDAYPNLESLDAHKTITIADIRGPAQINVIHITANPNPSENERLARSVILEIFFDDGQPPAVSAPLGDFFADGTGRGVPFSTPFFEKSPDAYNCYLPMPFQKSARVTLRNESDHDITNYSYVEWQKLPGWDASLGYFHASWQRLPFQLTPDTTQNLFSLTGPGHLVGEYWNINTDEPEFAGLNFVMEGNNEFRVDGEKEASLNYLGSEDSFNFSWGWRQLFNGYKNGINYLSFKLTPAKLVFENESREGKRSRLSTYRFRDRDVIRFERTLLLTVNWTAEYRSSPEARAFLDRLRQRNQEGGGWVDYAVTPYWYSTDPKGPGLKMPAIEGRLQPVLHSNK